MESRLLVPASSTLSSKASRSSLSCCYAWYRSIQFTHTSSRRHTRTNIRHAHTSKRSTSKSGYQKSAASIEGVEPSSRAFSRLNDLLRDTLQILSSEQPPTEAAILDSLSTCHDLAKYFTEVQETPNTSSLKANSAAANLLFLDSHSSRSSSVSPSNDVFPQSAPSPYIASSIASEAMANISNTIWDLVRDPKVFITPSILKTYVNIQALLSHPETLAEVFSLYASKPIPTPSSGPNPIKYVPSNPNNLSTAIPLDVATTALSAAVRSENLPLALDIIDRTVCTTSYKRAKFVKQALIPTTGLALAPVAAYSLATQFSLFQQSMPSANATGLAFAGFLTYAGATATIGIVALTTANDHMDRVTWAGGMPLRERWMREDERAMLDLVAAAWGFKESWKRGEEEGPEWQALKELIGIRGMVLDKVELMEGME